MSARLPDLPAAPSEACTAGPAGAPVEASSAHVRRYYEANTGRFLTFGGSGDAAAIHRGLWADGVVNARDAAQEINRRIAARALALRGSPPRIVRDLGCGVGGSLFHLARAWPEARLSGLTLSPRQARLGARLAARQGLQGRCRILCADFLAAMPQGTTRLPPADLVIAVESHVHAPSPGAFLRSARAHLAQGGHLVIVDDMLAQAEAALPAAARAHAAAFRRGWQLGHLAQPDALRAAARAEGMDCIDDIDLTALLRLDRWRDRALHRIAPLADALGLGRWPFWANMIGGNGLTSAYLAGAMRYRMMVFAA